MSAITDDAVEAAAAAIGALRRQGPEHYYRDARAALEAALPYLPPQPVASRERVAEVLYLHDNRNPLVGSASWGKAMTLSRRQYLMRADALLAAGVFREPPTWDQVEQAVTDKLIVSDALVAPGYSARIEADADDIAEAVAHAVLALIGGEAK